MNKTPEFKVGDRVKQRSGDKWNPRWINGLVTDVSHKGTLSVKFDDVSDVQQIRRGKYGYACQKLSNNETSVLDWLKRKPKTTLARPEKPWGCDEWDKVTAQITLNQDNVSLLIEELQSIRSWWMSRPNEPAQDDEAEAGKP